MLVMANAKNKVKKSSLNNFSYWDWVFQKGCLIYSRLFLVSFIWFPLSVTGSIPQVFLGYCFCWLSVIVAQWPGLSHAWCSPNYLNNLLLLNFWLFSSITLGAASGRDEGREGRVEGREGEKIERKGVISYTRSTNVETCGEGVEAIQCRGRAR